MDNEMASGGHVRTLHPTKRNGITIPAHFYFSLKNFIYSELGEHGQMELNELLTRAQSKLAFPDEANLSWFILHVKLDLEARGFICTHFFKNQRTQVLRLKKHRRIH